MVVSCELLAKFLLSMLSRSIAVKNGNNRRAKSAKSKTIAAWYKECDRKAK
ncbi:hypothetical protein NDI45_21570 [Leptolyngbya sp. GB1-A1]|uniref:hypothetical protein n=1 Tax=Leptolyngbya sp. GB1-A1 TaxID=2933908 RepID=UPI00329712DF